MTTRTATDLLDWLLTPLSWAVENADLYWSAWVLAWAFTFAMVPLMLFRLFWKATVMADLTLIEWSER